MSGEVGGDLPPCDPLCVLGDDHDGRCMTDADLVEEDIHARYYEEWADL